MFSGELGSEAPISIWLVLAECQGEGGALIVCFNCAWTKVNPLLQRGEAEKENMGVNSNFLNALRLDKLQLNDQKKSSTFQQLSRYYEVNLRKWNYFQRLCLLQQNSETEKRQH